MDLVLGAEGPAAVAAHEAAWLRFQPLLDELVSELPLLRQAIESRAPWPTPASSGPRGQPNPVAQLQWPPPCPLHGKVARRMWLACAPFAAGFITPMAAVAGAVAQELMACYERPGIGRAWANNGGDIALFLAPGQSVSIGLVADLARVQLDGQFRVQAQMPVRGIATSGWRGRSFSLGIADSVTVLARSAAMADAAATVVANAVNAADPRIVRRPAHTLKDDSDLGAHEVTYEVPALPAAVVQAALQRGAQRACELRAAGLIHAAVLLCQGRHWRVDPVPAVPAALDDSPLPSPFFSEALP